MQGLGWCRKNLKSRTALQTKNIMHVVKHGGGSVMVLGAIEATGIEHLSSVGGIMDRCMCKSILEEHLQPSVNSWDLVRD
ncbi:hypothetical protein Trydic_g4165 [Trypoxylus dichotomus]